MGVCDAKTGMWGFVMLKLDPPPFLLCPPIPAVPPPLPAVLYTRFEAQHGGPEAAAKVAERAASAEPNRGEKW